MITRHRLLFILGIWIVLIPFLGFPTSYKSFFVIVSGLIVALIAFTSARAKRAIARRTRSVSHTTRTPHARRERASHAAGAGSGSPAEALVVDEEPEVLTEVIPDKENNELDLPR